MLLEAGKSLTEVLVGSKPGEDSMSKVTILILTGSSQKRISLCMKLCVCMCVCMSTRVHVHASKGQKKA